MSDFIPVNTPLMNGNELAYLTECIETGWISSEGPFVKKFEEQMAVLTDRQFGVSCANGSAALDIAIAALKIKAGDEVILPSHTIISCAAAIVHAGATPVLVDSDPITWNMDVSQIEAKITPNTKAIMAVHLYGLPADLNAILDIAERHNLYVIEDAAQMIGQTYKGKPCGSFGHISTFSFYPNKHVTSGEGGMCLTNDPDLRDRCQSFRNLCFQPKRRFIHEELGWNYRLTNLQAAVGLAQTEQLTNHVEKKRDIGNMYLEGFKGMTGCQLPLKETDYAENIYWIFGLVIDDNIDLDNDTIMKMLGEKAIGTRPFFWPMHEQPVFKKMGLFEGENYPVAERLARKGFYVPCGLGLENDQIKRTIQEVRKIFENV